MKEQTQTLQIYRDGELDTELMPPEPNVLEAAVGHVQAAVGHAAGHVVLQARMATFDALHGTNYRQIRNNLMAQKRREEFERSIGLVAVDRKG